MPQHVYSPLDNASEFKHNGLHYPLSPNQTTVIVSQTKGISDAQVAEYAVARLGKWGVCLTKGPVRKADGKGVATLPEDQVTVDRAENTYMRAMHAWAEALIIEDSKENAPRVKSGLAPKHTEDWKKAKGWLAAHPDPPEPWKEPEPVVVPEPPAEATATAPAPPPEG